MKKTLFAATALGCTLLGQPAPAQFAVIDVANLQQNVQQTLQQVTELIRLLQQIQLLTQQVTGTDFSLSPALIGSLQDVQRVLGAGTAIVFQEAESLEQFQTLFPEVFEAIDTLQGIIEVVRGQTQQILDASQQAVQSQSASAEAIQGIIANIEGSLLESNAAVGQTHAIQVSNQISAQIATILAQIQGSQLAAQRLQALDLAHQASTAEAADEARTRFHAEDAFLGAGGHVPPGWQ
jgi:P-type conjugative transfer protein TrbJ